MTARRARGALVFLLAAATLHAASLSRRERDGLADQAQALFDAGKPAEARALWERALADGPPRAEARRWRAWVGRCFEAEGNYQRALTAYQEAADEDPANIDRLVDLGRVYNTIGLEERALELYERALRRDGARRDVRVAVADLHARAGRLTEARRQAEDALKRDPRDPTAQLLMARIEESQGDLAGAARRRESVLAARPSGPEAVALGRLWARAGELDLAEEAFRRAAAWGADSAALSFERGAVAWRRADNAAAETWFSRALVQDPGHATAALMLAVVDWERGRSARAAERLRGLTFSPGTLSAALREQFRSALAATSWERKQR